MSEVAREHTDLSETDRDWLGQLLADWQIVADMSFADLVLWLPDRKRSGFYAAAHMRPTTGPTAIADDIVGTFMPAQSEPRLRAAYFRGRISRDGEPEWRHDVPVRVEAIPVGRAGRVIAVIGRNTNLHGVRTPSRLELAYLETAGELFQMIAEGDFPRPGERGDHADSPRVGDGFMRLDPDGAVTYASPNALSVYRKLGLAGDLAGQQLAQVTRDLVPASRRPDEHTLSAALDGRHFRDTEVGNGAATLVVRTIPLTRAGESKGAVVLLRDVTELRRRDRELVTKDATIREIHHRVKNNLQTVAALLRMQSRRLDNQAGRFALDEAVRRVGAIAVVHEMLSQSHEEAVDFDNIADELARLVVDVGSRENPVWITREGAFGMLPSELATPLAMVLTELLQNCVEHAMGPEGASRVEVVCQRDNEEVRFAVIDDGAGWPAGFDIGAGASLGLSIVNTLIGELGGIVETSARDDGGSGAVARVRVPLVPE